MMCQPRPQVQTAALRSEEMIRPASVTVAPSTIRLEIADNVKWFAYAVGAYLVLKAIR